MRSICLFVGYTGHGSLYDDLPLIRDLQKQFTKVLVLTDKPSDIPNLDIKVFDNEGYDFGFWYKGLKTFSLDEYDRIAFVNNSNVLLSGKSLNDIFEWASTQSYDMWGVTDSYEAPKGVLPSKSYHIQSHFLVFEKKAIPYILDFYKSVKFENILNIKEVGALRQSVINKCEIGISQYMLSKKLSIGSRYKADKFVSKVSTRNYKKTNMHVWLWEELIKKGYPLVKKKIIKEQWKFLPNLMNYKKYF
jgi:hypothetical protein